MSEVIGIRVPKKLKEELQELNVDYAEEVRSCLEKMVKQKKIEKILKKANKHREELRKKYGEMPSSVDFIRWDREHGHT
jgi:hypothetical protein